MFHLLLYFSIVNVVTFPNYVWVIIQNPGQLAGGQLAGGQLAGGHLAGDFFEG